MLASPKDDDVQNDASALLTFWKQYQYARRCPCERCTNWLMKISNEDIQFAGNFKSLDISVQLTALMEDWTEEKIRETICEFIKC
jgi:hypothetical protein